MSSGEIPKKICFLGFFEIEITQTWISQAIRNLEQIYIKYKYINLFFYIIFLFIIILYLQKLKKNTKIIIFI